MTSSTSAVFFLKNLLCAPLFDMFWLQTFCTGNHWSGHKLISLNVHQRTQRPKDLSFLAPKLSQGRVDQKWLRVRNGSQLAAGRGLRQPFILFCPFRAFSMKAESRTMRWRRSLVHCPWGKFITIFGWCFTLGHCGAKEARCRVIISYHESIIERGKEKQQLELQRLIN